MATYDWEAIQAFLIGRCGKSERDCFYTSMVEYNALVDGKEKERREHLELARWERFIAARMDPLVRKKPGSPEDIVTFSWEKKHPETTMLSDITDAEAAALTNIFKQANL